MRILVTCGAGFIGSHTCDRLLGLGHEVVILDALTLPVHREGKRIYLSPGADFYQGDTRNRDLLTNLLRRVDAVYHLAAYQDYLPRVFPILGCERGLDRPDLRDHRGRALGHGPGWWWRRRSPRWVKGSTGAPPMGSNCRGCALDRSALAAGQWGIPCPACGAPLEMRATPERVSNPQNAYGMSKLGQEMVAVNLGRRYGIPTVALRYSIVQGPRQSVYNAYSGACRIFCLSHRQGEAPTLYEDLAGPFATTSTSTTWWMPTFSSWKTIAPPGGSSTSAAARR